MAVTVAPAFQAAYTPRGAGERLMYCRDREVCLEGPARSAKTTACLWKLLICAAKYTGMRGAILRKTRTSLSTTVLVTWEDQVLPDSGPLAGVKRGPNRLQRQDYRFPNGSVIEVHGLDQVSRLMSGEYDVIYIPEANEITLDDYERAMTRLSHYVMPYQQIITDLNPQFPQHWLHQRCDAGTVTLLRASHKDNPALWDGAAWTARGTDYIFGTLGKLTGVRRKRLLEGVRAAAEGLVYDAYDPEIHLRPRSYLRPESVRYYVGGVDWGYTKPGVITLWAVDGDGRMYRTHEVYRTRRLVNPWWIGQAKRLQEACGRRVRAWYCDPSEPAYIEDFRAAGLNAEPADNAIQPGIQAVQQRMVIAADGRPRLVLLEDALAERDEDLADAGQPVSSEDEVVSYVWAKDGTGRANRQLPVDEYNHAMDTWRYAVMGVSAPAKPRPTGGANVKVKVQRYGGHI